MTDRYSPHPPDDLRNDYVDSVDKLAETALPPKEAFYSRLNDEETTNEDYEHAKTVRKEFRIKTLEESLHDLHNDHPLAPELRLIK